MKIHKTETQKIALEKIHPELQDVYRKIPAMPFHQGWFRHLMPLVQTVKKRFSKPFSMPGVSSRWDNCGHVRVKIYQPEATTPAALVMWLHGGGYILGDASINDFDCSLMALELGVVVVSVDYRLAPKHRFPCALDDTLAVWQWSLANSNRFGVDTQRLVVAGQSAGAGLAAACVQKIVDDGGQQPLAQVLIYPMLDDRTAAQTQLDALAHPLWSNVNNRAAWQMYLGQPPGVDNLPPYAAPGRRQNLAGLPPTWLGCGTIDLFYQENLLYVQNLREAGIVCDFCCVDGAPHGFDVLAPNAEVARDFRQSYWSFLVRLLS